MDNSLMRFLKSMEPVIYAWYSPVGYGEGYEKRPPKDAHSNH